MLGSEYTSTNPNEQVDLDNEKNLYKLNLVQFQVQFGQVDPVTDLLSVWRVEDGHLLLQMIGLDFTKPSVWVLLNENPQSSLHWITPYSSFRLVKNLILGDKQNNVGLKGCFPRAREE